MKVAITGAGGFIGRALKDALSATGHEYVSVNLRDPGGLRSSEGAHAVVHLAGVAHRRAAADEHHRINVELTTRVARAAAAAGSAFVFLSSAKVHGEATSGALRESSPVSPSGTYAESKAAAEERLRSMHDLKLTILRPPTVYGPGVKANFLALMHAVALGLPLPLGSIANRRSLVYAGNLADAIVHCVETAAATGKTFFVCDGSPVSTPALCRGIGDALGRPARLLRFPPALLPITPLTSSLELDDCAIRRDLGWKPPFSFEEGLRRTAEWYRAR